MTTISIQHNIDKVLPEFRAAMNAKNMRFAVAKTLTQLAKESQEQTRRDMPRKFIIRRPWVLGGIRISPAARDRLTAVVYSLDSGGRRAFMTKQEFGGIKTPEGGSHLAIPLKAVQPNKRKLIPDIMKPKALLGSPIIRQNKRTGRLKMVSAGAYKALKVDTKKAGQQVILIKTGTVQGKNGKYTKYAPAWLLVPRARIQSQKFLTEATQKVVKDRASILLRVNAIEAMKPRRSG